MARHEYTLQEIIPIFTLRKEGYSYKKISERVKIPQSTVAMLVRKHAADNGAKLKVAPKLRGKNHELTKREKSAVIRNFIRNPQHKLSKVAKYGTGVHSLSENTVTRVIEEAGYLKQPTGKPILKQSRHKARLKWARAHRSWKVEDWDKVVWSGESSRLFGTLPTDKVWCRIGEQIDPSVFYGIQDDDWSFVRYWASIFKNGVGPICILSQDATMTSTRYQDVLENFLLPYYNPDCIFQHNNVPYHTTKPISKLLSDHNVTVLDWPAQSSDLNPIENIWHTLNLAIDKRMSEINSHKKLEEVVVEE